MSSSVICAYDDVNRTSSATGMGFTWDDNGNLLTWDDGSDDWAYRYDSDDRLINVKENGVASALYTYDAGGRRVRSRDTVIGITDYMYSGLNVIDEINGGAHEKHYYAGFMHLASNSSGTVEYYHVDHLGSTRLKTNSTGGVIYESNYEPYGPEYGESGSEEFRYTGKQEDSTGLYYFGARYYDPVTGRFTTRDSTFGDLTDPQSLNRYSYCRNNPQKYIDPDGRVSILIIPLGVSAAYMVNYLRGVYNRDYDFSWRLLGRAGLEGILQGTLLTASGCAMALTHFNPVAVIVVAELSVAAEVGVIPGVLGAYDVLTGENQVMERVADQVEEELIDAPTEFAYDVAGVPKGEDSDTIDLALESTSKTGVYYNDSYLRPPDYEDRSNVVIPPDYIDRPWR